jgi:hypothetical protein
MLETVSKSELYLSDETIKAFCRTHFPEVKTERGLLNVAYRNRAIQTLKDTPGCSWLCDYEKMKAGEKGAWKPTILIELGKIKDTEAMKAIALELCELKPGQKDGALLVKQARLGKPSGDSIQLYEELIHTVNNYLKRYELNKDELIIALEAVIIQIREES